MLSQELRRIRPHERVVCVAPTGVAACLLEDGDTYHHKLNVTPPQRTKKGSLAPQEPQFRKPSPQALKKLREAFRDVSLIVLDETSMVCSTVLQRINVRLQQAKDNEAPFGG